MQLINHRDNYEIGKIFNLRMQTDENAAGRLQITLQRRCIAKICAFCFLNILYTELILRYIIVKT